MDELEEKLRNNWILTLEDDDCFYLSFWYHGFSEDTRDYYTGKTLQELVNNIINFNKIEG